jgi:small-conductance mechanosensitive channel
MAQKIKMKKTSPKAKQKTAKKENGSSVKNIFLQIVNTFFHNLLDQLQDGIKVRLNDFLQETKKVAVIMFLIILGASFLFFGMASMIDFATGIKGAGFLLVGILLALIGFLLNMFSKKQ